MTELQQALAEISAIRAQVARGTQFRGYGPLSIASSGVLALLVAAAQVHWLRDSMRDVAGFLVIWISTAAVSVILATLDTVGRARRVHLGFAGAMLQSAVGQFLPPMIAGFLLTAVVTWAAPQNIWMLPGLWELVFSLGVFASCRFLPRQMLAAGAWYLACGLICLIIESDRQILSPWAMGIPFGLGQLFIATILYYGSEDSFEES